MPGIPAGKTSSVKVMDKTFILQTEFRLKPKPAIVTSVALDGQVMHKVERQYIRPYEADHDFRAAEDAINAQHTAIARKLSSGGADFIGVTKEPTISISREDKLGVISGVSFVANLEEKLAADNPSSVYIQSKLIVEISDAIRSGTRSGRFLNAAVISKNGKFILDKSDGKAYLLSLKPEAEISKIITEIKNA